MTVISILFPGRLGSALGRSMARVEGTLVTTCLAGRSDATVERAHAARFLILDSLEDVVRQSRLVVSLVQPKSALAVAQRFAECVINCTDTARVPLYVDANSASPQTKEFISQILASANVPCIDAAFFGPANMVGKDNVLVLSGPGSWEVAEFFRAVIEVKVIGDRVGQASASKMTIAIMTKALPALFLQMVSASARHGQVDLMLDMMRRIYPGILTFLERTIPTYPTHVARRVGELEEVSRWLRDLGEYNGLTLSAAEVLERLRIADLAQRNDWRFDELLRVIGELHFLAEEGISHAPDTF